MLVVNLERRLGVEAGLGHAQWLEQAGGKMAFVGLSSDPFDGRTQQRDGQIGVGEDEIGRVGDVFVLHRADQAGEGLRGVGGEHAAQVV
ncbi:hypothetical protein SDC9_186308 [bioreactor metagenome]|uniref:Uncharacterized protein n=1 Tax=bioreactor metagenome TaxID=1076179 RepID=A0A645HTS7_9ZZZZ